jgi:hypothetical protein
MNSYNYSYNVLINRLEAFAAGHLLIKRFTHGQIDLADMDQNEQYPFMHVVPNNIKPVEGGMQFDFQILFADIPRDKETKAEYQREVISDCVRLAQDLIAEVKNGLILFGFDVQLVTPPVIEPFVEEYKNTLTGVSFSLQLEVPWDWSACDIPAVWSVGGTSSGGTGNAYGITLKTNGVNNAVQNILDLVAGSNITITDNGDGSVTFDASGGNTTVYVSTEFNVNHGTATGNQYVVGDRVWYNGNVYACIANNDAILPTNATYWTLQGAGFRLRQTPVDWNASTGDYQILNKPTIPTLTSELTNDSGFITAGDIPPIPTLTSELTNDSGYITIGDVPPQANADWNAVSGVAEILNKPTIPAAQGLQDVITTDPVLTTNNVIDGSNQQIEFSDFGKISLLSNNKLDIYSGNTGLTATTNSISVGAEDGTVQSNISFDVNGSIMQSIDGADFTAITTEPNALKIATPNIAGGSATVGQVLTLSNAGTGEVEFTTAGVGTVTSVALTAPAAFSVTGSPITTAGTLAISAAGTSAQYVRGDGQLATTPTALPPNGAASGDLTGSYPNPTVHRIHGIDMQSGTPTANDVWLYGGSPAKWQHQSVKTVNSTSIFGSGDIATGTVTSVAALTIGTSGSDLASTVANSTTTPVITLNVPTASASNRGALSSADWSTFNGKQNNIGLTTVGTNLATLTNPSAVRYLRINASNGVDALTLAQLKTDLGLGSAVVASNVTNVGTGFEDVTGLSFTTAANKTYKWRATISFTATAAITFSSNGPTASINNARFTTSLAATTNAVSNQTAYDSGTNAAAAGNGLCTADGIVRTTAAGTFIIRIRCATAALLTVRAGSIIEFEEVL